MIASGLTTAMASDRDTSTSLDDNLGRLLDRIIETQIASVCAAYQKRIQRLPLEKVIARGKVAELTTISPPVSRKC